MDKNLKVLIFKSIGLAMGISTLVLNIMKAINVKNSIILLSIGLICLALNELENRSSYK